MVSLLQFAEKEWTSISIFVTVKTCLLLKLPLFIKKISHHLDEKVAHACLKEWPSMRDADLCSKYGIFSRQLKFYLLSSQDWRKHSTDMITLILKYSTNEYLFILILPVLPADIAWSETGESSAHLEVWGKLQGQSTRKEELHATSDFNKIYIDPTKYR